MQKHTEENRGKAQRKKKNDVSKQKTVFFFHTSALQGLHCSHCQVQDKRYLGQTKQKQNQSSRKALRKNSLFIAI